MEATWTCRDLVTEAMKDHDESWSDVVATAGDLAAPVEGGAMLRFTVWTHRRVYFPHDYDGYYSARSAMRNPCSEECTG